VQFMTSVFWRGELITKGNLKYADSTDHSQSAPATQWQLINRVNETIDKCLKYISESIAKDQRVYLFASNRMIII
jgi:hypothetical protein